MSVVRAIAVTCFLPVSAEAFFCASRADDSVSCIASVVGLTFFAIIILAIVIAMLIHLWETLAHRELVFNRWGHRRDVRFVRPEQSLSDSEATLTSSSHSSGLRYRRRKVFVINE